MSIYLTSDGGDPEFISSNLGWSEFGEWVDDLDVADYENIVALWEHGWSQSVADFRKQLKAAVAKESPKKDVATVAELLLEFSDGAKVVTITDGFGPATDGDKSSDDAENKLRAAGYTDAEIAARRDRKHVAAEL